MIEQAIEEELLARKFWEKQLRTEFSGIPFEPMITTVESGICNLEYRFSKNVQAEIDRISGQRPFESFLIQLSLFTFVFHRYYQLDTVGFTTLPLKDDFDDKDLIPAMIPLVFSLGGHQSLRQLLIGLNEIVVDTYSYVDFPIETIEKREITLGQLNVLIFSERLHCDLPIELTGQFDLIIREMADGQLSMTYKASRLSEAFVLQILGHLENIIPEFSTTENPIAEIDFLSEEERKELLTTFNQTDFDYPENVTVTDIIRDFSLKHPQYTAVEEGQLKISYQELNDWSDHLAKGLRHHYGDKKVVIAVIADKSWQNIISILGLFKSGCIYLPINSRFPIEKVKSIIEMAGVESILVKKEQEERFQYISDKPLIFFEDLLEVGKKQVVDLAKVQPNEVAYLITTSGTTGVPKGVVIEHTGLVNVSLFNAKQLAMGLEDRYLQFMSPSFDGALHDIFTTLLAGAQLILVDDATIADPALFINFLAEKKISVFTVTPSYLKMLQKDRLETVRTLITAGEPCDPELAKYYAAFKVFYNEYGPTEVTINASNYRVDPQIDYQHRIPIGKPSGNKQIYILDTQQKLLSLGAPGDIYIAGNGLARGYWNDQKLTEEKFITNPFCPSQKMYRTGDQGRWLPDGNIDFIGRADSQIKIRGFRIELGEIENRLLEFNQIHSVIVQHFEEQENIFLAAYYLADQALSTQELQNYLKLYLPDYMWPKYYVHLSHFPLNFNGKIDKKSLPDPQLYGELYETPYLTPKDEVERQIQSIWQEVLQIEKLGINHNFFEIGGTSMAIMKVHKALNKQFEKPIAVANLFEYTTIKEIARFYRTEEKGKREVSADDDLDLLQQSVNLFLDQQETENNE